MKQKIRTLAAVCALALALSTNVYAAETGNGNKAGSTVETTTNEEGNATTIITDKNGNSLIIEDLGENFDEDNIELEPDEETDGGNSDDTAQSGSENTQADSTGKPEETMNSANKTEAAGESAGDTAKQEKTEEEKSHNYLPVIIGLVVLVLVAGSVIMRKKR